MFLNKKFLLVFFLFTFVVVNGDKLMSMTHQSEYIPVEKISTVVFNSTLSMLNRETQNELLKLLLKFEDQEKKKLELKQKLIQHKNYLLKQKQQREQEIYQKHLVSRVKGSILNDLLTLRY